MRFWPNNRLDGSFEAPVQYVVDQFRASAWWTANLDLPAAIRGFLTDTDGPISAVWDDEADLTDLCDQAHAAGRTGAPAQSPPAVA